MGTLPSSKRKKILTFLPVPSIELTNTIKNKKMKFYINKIVPALLIPLTTSH
jgi:hypothetical protein